jgi:hypothetical protein
MDPPAGLRRSRATDPRRRRPPEPGLAFVGLRFQRSVKSDLFYGVGEDAELVVGRLVAAN